MDNSPILSIIMPVKNAMPYLKECLSSILDQTFKHWELIAINDGSIDASGFTLTQFAKQDNRIRVITNHGHGIVDALRTGFDCSRGKFITRMDADDIMPVKKLELFMDSIPTNTEEPFVITGHVKYMASNKALGEGYIKYAEWLNALNEHSSHWEEIYKECVIASPNWLCSKKHLECIGGIENNCYPEDYELCFRWYKHHFKVIPIKQITHIWRDHSNRTSRSSAHYSDNRFIALKAKMLIELESTKHTELVLWGAGKKGKLMAQTLQKMFSNFTWVCNNPNKIGKIIYNVQLIDSQEFQFNKNHLVVVCTTQDNLSIKAHVQNSDAQLLTIC